MFSAVGFFCWRLFPLRACTEAELSQPLPAAGAPRSPPNPGSPSPAGARLSARPEPRGGRDASVCWESGWRESSLTRTFDLNLPLGKCKKIIGRRGRKKKRISNPKADRSDRHWILVGMGEGVKVNKSRLPNWKAEASPLCTQGFRERKARARGKRREIYLRPTVSPIQKETEEKRKKCWEKPSEWGERLGGAESCPAAGRDQASPRRSGRRMLLQHQGERAAKREGCNPTWWKEIALLEIFFLNEVPWQVYLHTFLFREAKGSNGASKISFI